MSDLTPLRGNAARIKFHPCPEGCDAQVGTVIGELTCDQCDELCLVKLNKGRACYAYCNSSHPRRNHDKQPCGNVVIKLNRVQSANVIRHWTAQRYAKKAPANATPIKSEPKPAPVKEPATKPAAVPAAKSGTGSAARKPAAEKPAAKPAAVDKPASAGTVGDDGPKPFWEL